MTQQIDAIDGADVLPGYMLSRLGPAELGELERHFKVQHLSEAVSAAHTTEAAQVLTATAMQNNARGVWRHGTPGFIYSALTPANLPKMLALALRRKHPAINEADAANLITAENEPLIHTAVLALCGVDVPAAK